LETAKRDAVRQVPKGNKYVSVVTPRGPETNFVLQHVGKVYFHFPRNGQTKRSIADEWIRFSDGSNFTDTSIGFVADMFPQIVEQMKSQSQGPFWYPTLLLNLDVKKALPSEGVRWLHIRAEIKRIQKGRMDIEVFVHDADGDLVALSHHVGFVMDASRNLASRRQPDSKM
jgi:hypothetical protein